jgi:polynucleotide 5'-triphosphatase
LRVTRDGKGDVKAVVSKGRIADMNVYSPKRVFDWRLSINTEIPCTSPSLSPLPLTNPKCMIASSPPTPSTHTRQKDRISYSHQNFLIDLTQVTTTPTSSAPTHELEIEFKDARVLLEEGGKEERGEENVYLALVQCFLNNIREFSLSLSLLSSLLEVS